MSIGNYKFLQLRCLAYVLITAIPVVSSVGRSADAQPKPAPGLEVGQEAPPLKLQDQHGKERSLSDFLAKGPVSLVFYRSADW